MFSHTWELTKIRIRLAMRNRAFFFFSLVMPLIFLFAWMKADAHPGDSVSGAGPQVLYEFVKNLEQGQPPS